MESPESWERFWEGLSRAASCCRELAVITKAHQWGEMARQLLIMRDKGLEIYKSSPLTEMQVQALVSQMEYAQKMAQAMNTVH